jgi:hypothetical protein
LRQTNIERFNPSIREETMRERQRFIRLASLLVGVLAWMMMVFAAFAVEGDDPFGKPDTCRIAVEQDQKTGQGVIHVSVFNDENLAALTLPFSYGDGKSPVRCDSVRFRNTRSESFDMITANIDTVAQTVLIGLIADMTGRKPPMEKGDGAVATIYFTFPANQRFHDFVMDTTWVRPFNLLKFVTPDVKAVYPEFDNSQALLRGGIPIRAPEKPKEGEDPPEKKAEEKK